MDHVCTVTFSSNSLMSWSSVPIIVEDSSLHDVAVRKLSYVPEAVNQVILVDSAVYRKSCARYNIR